MNEERMIRITEDEYEKWQKFVRDFDDELKDYDVPKQLWVFFESKNLELAPPKDWQDYYHKVAELTAYLSETDDGSNAGKNAINVAIERLKEMPSKETVLALYQDARRTHRSVHSLTDLAFESAITIRLLRKLFPWLEPSSSMINNDRKE